MAFLLFNAFVSQTLPKLALSGYSGHLSSLLVLKQCPVTKKKKAAFHFGVISIYYKVNLFSFFFNPRRSESCLVSVDAPVWPHAAPPLFSLHDPSVCMHYLSVCPLPHTSTRDQALKDFHCIQTIFISLLLFLFLIWRNLGAFHVVLSPVANESSNLADLSWISHKKK